MITAGAHQAFNNSARIDFPDCITLFPFRRIPPLMRQLNRMGLRQARKSTARRRAEAGSKIAASKELCLAGMLACRVRAARRGSQASRLNLSEDVARRSSALPATYVAKKARREPRPPPASLVRQPTSDNIVQRGHTRAGVAELADAQDLGSCTERCRGSTPLSCTVLQVSRPLQLGSDVSS